MKWPSKRSTVLIFSLTYVALAILLYLRDSAARKSIASRDGETFNSNALQHIDSGISGLITHTSALVFDGTSNTLLVDSAGSLTDNFSFCFWVNPAETSGTQMLFEKGESCPDGKPSFTGQSYYVTLSEDFKLSMRIVSAGGNHTDEFLEMRTNTPLHRDEWNFVCITYDNRTKEFRCLTDGKPVSVDLESKSRPQNFVSPHRTSSSLKIGGEESYCKYIHQYGIFFKGKIDGVVIFNRTLNDAEAAALGGYSTLSGNLIRLTVLFSLILSFIFFFKPVSTVILSLFERRPVLGPILSTLLLGIILYYWATSQKTFSDTAYFGGDTWEYQSMAVNFAAGHGLHRFGALEPFEQYRFDREDPGLLKQFEAEAGVFDDYRTPLYPAFAGLVYKVFGVHPAIVKKIQLLMLVIIASILPWLGQHYWGSKGLLSGIIASFLYISINYPRSHDILAESLFSFGIFLIVVTMIWHEKKGSYISAAVLGVANGVTLLTKGNILFLPGLIFLYLLYCFWTTKKVRCLRVAVVFIFAFVLTIAPWSFFASARANKFIFLSTQSEVLLLDSNNEKCVDGDWHPEWKSDTSLFYHRDGLSDASSARRVVNFYLHNPRLGVQILENKILRTVTEFYFLFATIIIGLFAKMKRHCNIFSRNVSDQILIFCFLLFSLFHFSNPEQNTAAMGFIKVALILASCLVVKAAFENRLPVPFIFHAIFVSLILMILLASGQPRFVEVMNFLFILAGVHAIISFLYGAVDSNVTQPASTNPLKQSTGSDQCLDVSHR